MCLKIMPTTTTNCTAGGSMPESAASEAAAESRLIKEPPVDCDGETDAALADEVKVYSNEEDPDDREETKTFESRRDLLSDDKSTLINESEQSKDARQTDLAFSKQNSYYYLSCWRLF